MIHRAAILLGLIAAAQPVLAWQDRDSKVRNDRKTFQDSQAWVYNDLDKAIAEAAKTNKPILVILRCIPCEACKNFDDDVARRHPAIRDLMDRFVCARIVQGNGLDLSLFQFDYDQSFAVFVMNADKVIYGRFGTRSSREPEPQDFSMESFRAALEAALQLHAGYPANRSSLEAKRGPAPTVAVPEKFPSLRVKYTPKLNYEGKVAQSCIHCHQIREAQRRVYRDAGEPMPENVFRPWPMPSVLGLSLDPKKKATVAKVAKGSPTEKDGFKAGDELIRLDGQPLISVADIQWVLHMAQAPVTLKATILRDGKSVELPLSLAKDWRRSSEISWRPTTWDLRRMATGGLVLEPLPTSGGSRSETGADKLALLVKHVGQYGDHAVAKRAGFLKGDVIVEFDGKSNPMTETDLIESVLAKHKPGAKFPVAILRGGRPMTLELTAQ